MVVLHGLRVKGFADPATLVEFTGLGETEVGELLHGLACAGAAIHRLGPVPGWRLTDAGRAEHAETLAADLAQSQAGAAVADGFQLFVALDLEIKTLCTAWQVLDPEAGVINDHRDAEHDAAVVSSLAVVHTAARSAVGDLAAALARFGTYRDRLDTAHQRFRAGDRDALTKPLTGSYHDVWMELHEDLLVTLGLPR